MAKRFFTNREGNTLMKEFEGLLEHNSSIKCLDSVVGIRGDSPSDCSSCMWI